MLDPKQLSKFGIGTWGVGGYMERDNSLDFGKQTDAIAYMFENGVNFAEANVWYSQGASIEILSDGLKHSSKQREDIFICQAIYLKDEKTLADASQEVERLFELFETNYIDTIQFDILSFKQSSFAEISEWVEELIHTGKVRYTSITNENLKLLRKYHERFKDKLFSHEVSFNFEVRANEDLGIIPYADSNNIKTVIFQPIRRNRTAKMNWPLLVELSRKYRVSQNQIIMAWIMSKGYLPITKSETLEHINEYLSATNLEIEQDDLQKLNDFRVPKYEQPEIDWYKDNDGVTVDQLSNVFDDEYRKQTN